MSAQAVPARRRLRIGHVLGTANVGGTERQVLMLIQQADRERFAHEVLLIRGGPLVDDFAAAAPTSVFGKAGAVDLRFLWRLVRAARGASLDVLSAWGLTANLWGPLAAVLAGVPHLVTSERETDDWKGPGRMLADRLVGRRAAFVVGNSRAVIAAAAGRGVRPGKLAVIPNGVAVPAEPLEPAPGARIVLLGRVDRRKGHDLLVEALPTVTTAVPDVLVDFAGPAVLPAELSYKAELERRIETLGLAGRVRFTGPSSGPAAAFAGAAVVVVPSRSEGFPNVVLEAMAWGVPVVTTATGGTGELVEHGRTGLLVDAEGPASLAAAITATLTDRGAAAARARAARATVVERFSPQAMTRAWERLYERVAAGT